jgi:hypothetical protein
VVLDPFFGTGTTGAVAMRLHRHFIGIERSPIYVELARQRIHSVQQMEFDPAIFYSAKPRKEARIPFGTLLEYGLLEPGGLLYFGASEKICARILADGNLEYNGERGSIHYFARQIRQGPGNGWELWYFLDAASGQFRSINTLRQVIRDATKTEIADPEESSL